MARKASSQIYTQADMASMISQFRLASSDKQRELVKQAHKDLFVKSTFKVPSQKWHLIFGSTQDEALEVPEDLLTMLVGPQWEKRRANLYARMEHKILDRNDFHIDLSNVEPRYALSKFNILSQGRSARGRNIFGWSINGKGTYIAAAVILAIALTIEAARRGRGMFLWQRKSRARGDKNWTEVPDLILVDFVWQDHTRSAFENASYEQQRDSLCANLRLQKEDDVVLPFHLDFDGQGRKDDEAACVAECVIQHKVVKAAISIPGAAYIGWIEDMVRVQGSSKIKIKKNKVYLSATSRASTRVMNVCKMYERAIHMMDNSRLNSLVLYSDIQELARFAEEKEKEDKEEKEKEKEKEKKEKTLGKGKKQGMENGKKGKKGKKGKDEDESDGNESHENDTDEEDIEGEDDEAV